MKNSLFIFLSLIFFSNQFFAAEKFVFTTNSGNDFPLVVNSMAASVVVSDTDAGVRRAANNLMNDFRLVTGLLPQGFQSNAVIIGTLGQSEMIDNLVKNGKIDKNFLVGKREKFLIQIVDNPMNDVKKALIIAGSDKRGTIYGIYELSAQIGVSPWYWWADVPVAKQNALFVKNGKYSDGEPAVEYRGIFLNDEAPALSGWAYKTFGGFNHNFYEKVFELILRLKGNFLWPAMWGSAFYDDDPQNGVLANEMGIIISTSHHEPMGRAHDEWRRYGSGAWNYQANSDVLQKFWRQGMERMKNWEKVVTVGMRGDGDEPMSEGTNIALLEKIVADQRAIIQEITKQPLNKTPQVWALYKEVQDYYDKGMRVPDDIILLLCDDNWGNVRKLPNLDASKRGGGYGMYYHFDYVGGPRNYKWLNVSQIQRVWEQMNLTYQYGVSKLWVVNVGDLKPMEFPISFFMDMAWNPNQFNANNLMDYTQKWCAQQFGEKYAKQAAEILNLHNKYMTRVTPEILDANTYSLDNYNEFERVVNDYKNLNLRALQLYNLLPNEYKDCFDELVAFPVNAMCNLYEMYFAQAKNRKFAAENNVEANFWADKVKECYMRDSLLTVHYHNDIAGGKWDFMMSQTHIGYTYWQQPEKQTMPEITYVEPKTKSKEVKFIEKNGVISFEAQSYSSKMETANIKWITVSDLGRTLSGVITFPRNIEIKPNDNISLTYQFENKTVGDVNIHVLLAPTLNFNANKGLRYALSIDNGQEIIVNFNEKYRGELGDWQAQRIINSVTKMNIKTAGQHFLTIRALDNGIVLEKIMLDFGGLKPSYLGAPTDF
ncbi:MAG: glycosyl hydrolase 115 family protein [Paludibacter sp.]|nr:glycosyl hydrolase 115 family protein [Paludibacter sp.]